MSNLPSRHHVFDDFFRDLSPGYYFKPLHGDPLPAQIKIDVKESPDNYTVIAELAGVAKDDIHVTIDSGLVTVSAEVKQHDRLEDERVLRSERYYGAVSRSIQLPVDIDEAQARAKYDNGVLNLVLPKKRPNPEGKQRLRID
ncbi:Hsp20/alpha crystallin family protein [Chitinibacter sp. SCUT-21]|uniref:Hsp20/alpha crystallin family protein n=1 Tax=Chitinibacter sp. SCUT-21 TaxID=2970891 RepID=UPI0035A595D7